LQLQPCGGPSCLPSGATLTEAFTADIDGDGLNELVLAFTGPTGPDVMACQLLGFFGVGMAPESIDCWDIPSQLGLTSCTDVVVGQFALPSAAHGRQLAMVCGATVYRVDTSGVVVGGSPSLTFAATALTTLPFAAGSVTAIGAGDVNGDAVDDLLVLAVDPDGQSRIHVFPQLTSRQAGQ
jgi:hypothetical protein